MRLSDQDGKPITRRPEAERAAERARRTQRGLANEGTTLAGALDAYLLAAPARRGVRADREAFDKLADWCARRRPDARLLSDVTREDAAERLAAIATARYADYLDGQGHIDPAKVREPGLADAVEYCQPIYSSEGVLVGHR